MLTKTGLIQINPMFPESGTNIYLHQRKNLVQLQVKIQFGG